MLCQNFEVLILILHLINFKTFYTIYFGLICEVKVLDKCKTNGKSS